MSTTGPNHWKERAGSVAVRLGTALVSIVLVLLLAETLLRLFFDPPPRVETQGIQSDYSRVTLELESIPDKGGLYMQSPSGLRLRPNTHAVLRNERLSGRTIDIRTNSLGYRGPEVSTQEGTKILFLGDSITFANYLAEEETFVHLVAVNGAERGHIWNTINSGVGTISLDNELAILKETGLSLAPNVVVLAFYLNDFQESLGVFVREPPGVIASSRVAQHAARAISQTTARLHRYRKQKKLLAEVRRDLESKLDPGSGDWRQSQRAFDALILANHHDWGGAWSEEAWTTMVPLFEELKRLSDEHGFQLAFIALPVSFQVHAAFVDDWPQRRLAEVAESLGVPMLDLLPAHRHAKGELFYDSCHHTALGAQVVAEEIADFLSTQGLTQDPEVH